MGDRRLGEVDARLDIRGAEAHILADRAGSALFECLENSAPGGIGDGVQHTIQGLLWIRHGLAINRESMVVNVGVRNLRREEQVRQTDDRHLFKMGL
jgi:hypothetical protein